MFASKKISHLSGSLNPPPLSKSKSKSRSCSCFARMLARSTTLLSAFMYATEAAQPFKKHNNYRVTKVVAHLGFVDSDLGSSPGWWAVTAATCCPTGDRRSEHPKSKSAQPRCATTMVTL